MGLFVDTSWEEGRKLFYNVDKKKGVELMKQGAKSFSKGKDLFYFDKDAGLDVMKSHAKTADEFHILAWKYKEAGKDAEYKDYLVKEAEIRAKKTGIFG